jgi:hypothetical protein
LEVVTSAKRYWVWNGMNMFCRLWKRLEKNCIV